MSYYAPRVYSTTKHLSQLGAEPAERYSNVSKKDYLPNEQEVDLEGTPEKRRIFFALLLTLAMTQTLYLNISTFLPTFRKEHHPSIDDGMVGIILS